METPLSQFREDPGRAVRSFSIAAVREADDRNLHVAFSWL
jgi:hypothetical protein